MDNLFSISSSIKKYEKQLNSSGLKVKNHNNNGIGKKANALNRTNNNSIEKNNIITNFNRDKIKIPLINMNKVNVGNINIIDDTKDEEINSIGNSNIERINIKTNLGRNSQNKIKSRNENASQKKK